MWARPIIFLFFFFERFSSHLALFAMGEPKSPLESLIDLTVGWAVSQLQDVWQSQQQAL